MEYKSSSKTSFHLQRTTRLYIPDQSTAYIVPITILAYESLKELEETFLFLIYLLQIYNLLHSLQ
jgi:hypothetical protein